MLDGRLKAERNTMGTIVSVTATVSMHLPLPHQRDPGHRRNCRCLTEITHAKVAQAVGFNNMPASPEMIPEIA